MFVHYVLQVFFYIDICCRTCSVWRVNNANCACVCLLFCFVLQMSVIVLVRKSALRTQAVVSGQWIFCLLDLSSSPCPNKYVLPQKTAFETKSEQQASIKTIKIFMYSSRKRNSFCANTAVICHFALFCLWWQGQGLAGRTSTVFLIRCVSTIHTKTEFGGFYVAAW